VSGRRGDDLLLLALGRDGLRYVTGLAGEAFAELFEACLRHPEVVYLPAPDSFTVLSVADGLGRATGGPVVVNLRHAPPAGLDGRFPLAPWLPAVVLTDRPGPTLAVKARLEPAGPAELVEAVRVAARTVILPPTGPVQVAFGPEILAAEGPAEIPYLRRQYLPRTQPPDPEAVREAADLLLAAERPLLVAGPELVRYGAVDEAAALAERLALPVFLDPAPGPCPGFPTGHPACHGHPVPDNPAWAGADLVVVVGRLRPAQPVDPLLGLMPAGARILAVSPWGPEWVTAHGRGLELIADPASGLRALREQVERWLTSVEARRAAERRRLMTPPAGPPDPVVEPLLDYLGADGVLLVDDPAVTADRIRRPNPATLWPAPPGLRGWGVGAAVGAWLGLPTRRQALLADDAALIGGLGGLWTAVRFRLPIRVAVRNRQAYTGIRPAVGRRGLQGITEADLAGLDEPVPDLKALVEAFGARYVRTAAAELGPTLADALGFDGPVVVEIA
jgi:benzoylformate decarboxylase